MRIAVIIIALCVFVILLLQSCAVGIGGSLGKSETLSQGAAIGVMLAFMYVLGAAFASGVPLVSTVVFAFGARCNSSRSSSRRFLRPNDMGLAFGHSGRPVHFRMAREEAARGEIAMRGIEASWPQDQRHITKIILGLVVLAASLPAQAQQTTIRDASGRTIGTVTTDSNGTKTFRDGSGRTTGTATTDSNGTTTFRDASGRTTGTASQPQR
jgi:YD repeat-containing protein